MNATAAFLATLLSTSLLLSGCGKAEAPEGQTATAAGANAAAQDAVAPETATVVEKKVVLMADDKTGELGIDLPGGVGASLRLPPEIVRQIGQESKLDIDGVGLYPGARVTRIAATSREGASAKSDSATIRFIAPSKPQAVADWYVAAFREKGHTASQKGSRVEGTTTEGSRFTLDLTADGDGTAGDLVVDSKMAG
jgi:hypothetical protein